MSGWPSLPSCNGDHLAAQVGMSCGLPRFLPVCRQDLIVKDLVFWDNPTLAIALRRANPISPSVLFFMVSIQVDIHQFV